MVSSTHWVSLGYLPCHLASHWARSGLGLGEIAAVVEPAELLQAVVAMLPRQVVKGVPEEVNVAALIGSLGEHLANGGPEAGVVVGDDELDAVKAAGLEGEEEVLPGGAALAVGHLDGEDLAAAVPIDADRDQHRLAHNHAGLAHLLITSVEARKSAGFSVKGAIEPDAPNERGPLAQVPVSTKEKVGGLGRNRTRVHGFAVRAPHRRVARRARH